MVKERRGEDLEFVTKWRIWSHGVLLEVFASASPFFVATWVISILYVVLSSSEEAFTTRYLKEPRVFGFK